MTPLDDNQTATIIPPMRKTQLIYILAYRAPNYIRTRSLLQALARCSNVELLVARNQNPGICRYIETWRALRQLRRGCVPDIYVLGFRGHEIFWPIRWITRGKPLIFDALMSPSAALREENKAGWLGRTLAPIVHRMERNILHHADLVLTDTRQHAAFYETKFGLPKEKILIIPVGAVEIETPPAPPAKTEAATTPFNVLFYGSMLPLHGIDIIVSAAAQLRDLPIRFDFVGGSVRQAQHLRKLCARHGVTYYTHRPWVPLDELMAIDIPNASLCLGGPFGGTSQAQRVITGKTSQCLALGKATVVGNIDDDVEFLDKYNCLLVPQADPDALAATLRWGFVHGDALHHIGQRGRELYQERLSLHCIQEQLTPALLKLSGANDSPT